MTVFPTLHVEVELSDQREFMDGTSKTFMDGTAHFMNYLVYTDITEDVNRQVRHERGIAGSTPIDRIAKTGKASFYLNNSASNSGTQLGYYSPDNTNVRPGWQEDQKVRIGYALAGYDSGNTNWRWYGWISKITPVPGQYAERTVQVDCVDYIQILNENTRIAQVAIQTDATSDEAYTALLAAMARQPEGTSFSTGVDTLEYILHRSGERSGSGYEEMNRVALSVFDYVYVDKDGQVVSQNRHDRLKDATVQFTITGTQIKSMKYDRDRQRGLDKVTTKTYPVEVGTSNETAYELQNPIRLNPGDTYTLEAAYKDPNSQSPVGITDPVTLATGTNVRFGSAPDLSSQNLNSKLTIVSQNFYSGEAVVVFRNDGGRLGFINEVTVQGKLIRFNDPVTSTYTVNSNGNRTVTINLPYQDSEVFAENLRKMIVNVYSQSKRVNSVKINLNDSTWFANYMDNDIGKRIAISETVTGLSSDEHFINHELVEYNPGKEMNVNYTLAPSLADSPGIWGTSKWNQANWAFAEG